jgi:hypothetical protein
VDMAAGDFLGKPRVAREGVWRLYGTSISVWSLNLRKTLTEEGPALEDMASSYVFSWVRGSVRRKEEERVSA